jgi:hypothetical protein
MAKRRRVSAGKVSHVKKARKGRHHKGGKKSSIKA